MNADSKKDGGAAFPRDGRPLADGTHVCSQSGMTLRDWFAGQALSGEIASSSSELSCKATAYASLKAGRSIEYHVAVGCYEIADAMLAARERKEVA